MPALPFPWVGWPPFLRSGCCIFHYSLDFFSTLLHFGEQAPHIIDIAGPARLLDCGGCGAQSFCRHVRCGAFYPVPGRPANVDLACQGYELLLKANPIDVCCLGIGENGHVAFNEPQVADCRDPGWLKQVYGGN